MRHVLATEIFKRTIAPSLPGRGALAAALGCIAVAVSAVQPPVAHAQAYSVLQSFSGGADGAYPNGSLTLSGSTLYGMTSSGGTASSGNVFAVNTDGSGFQSLYSFSGGADGAYPNGSLTLSGSTLYGMTVYGGTASNGNVFAVNTAGSGFQSLYSFSGGTDGVNPWGSLTLNGSTLFGMTYGGGRGNGNIFSISTSGGGIQGIYSFSGSDGAAPFGSLTLSTSTSTLYGMTCAGGTVAVPGGGADGNIFSIGANGTGFQNLLSFSGTGGANPGQYPAGDLTLSGSTLYGMTYAGGASGNGNIFSVNTDGTGFRNLLSFNGADGASPNGDLVLSGSTLYGMTVNGGSNGDGTIFSIKIDGSDFQSLSFSGTGGPCPGANPYGSLTLSGSTLYGMASAGGDNNAGVVFSLGTAAVPEPGTFVLLGVGAITLAVRAWRRRRRSQKTMAYKVTGHDDDRAT